MRLILIILFISILFSSCLKKIEEADNLNTNIFDKEYAGGCWFNVTDTYSYINGDGQTKIRIEAVLPESNMPGLKPSSVAIYCSVNDQPELLLNVGTDDNGNYPFYYDAIPESSNEYCLEAGLYLASEDSTINRFVVCSQP